MDQLTSAFNGAFAAAPVIVTGDLAGYSNSIIAYPNPAENYFELSGIEGELSDVQLFDLAGRRRFIEFDNRGDGYRANVQHLAIGVYLLQIQQGKVLHSVKIVKK